ncbi:MAG: hypothetical protein AABX77_03490 [Nanoarchaeota archaeon]
MPGKSKKVDINQALLDNFINLQRVLTNLAIKFEDLSNNISKLLQLFEISAKSLADKPVKSSEIDHEFLKKLDSLLEQNKVISKGIMLMEDRVRGRMNQSPPPVQQPSHYRGFTRSVSE